MTRTEQERFWSFVVKGPEPDDCWFWTGAISDDGYGQFWVKRDGGQLAVRPQRYAWELLTGESLPSSLFLLHSCDIPICVHASMALRCRMWRQGRNGRTCSTGPSAAAAATGRRSASATCPGRCGCNVPSTFALSSLSVGGARN